MWAASLFGWAESFYSGGSIIGVGIVGKMAGSWK